LKVTAVAVVNSEPEIVTSVPTGPEVGANEVTTGARTTVKLAALVPVPAGFVTATGPVVAPTGTVAVIWRSESTTKLAGVPLKVTELAVAKLDPEIVTSVPTGPEVGAKEVTTGASITVKLAALVPVPAGFVTATGPVVAPTGTVAVIWTSESATKLADEPLKVTDVAVVNSEPEIVISVPTGPEAGENEVTTGATSTVKLAALVPVPAPFVTATGPVVAPAGTVAVIWTSESTTKLAGDPLKVTELAVAKLEPEIVTSVPTGPEVGAKEVTTGASITVKLAALVPVPAAFVTATGPVVAPTGTVAVI
jgi:acetyl-CoA carboxylase alpha subunit